MDLIQKKKPRWLKVRLPGYGEFALVEKILKEFRLTTVCENARCPNRGECWSKRLATIMIMGNVCTRHCRFCAVKTGNPGGYLEVDEPVRIAQAVKKIGLNYVVLTSVDRDDLEDGGAEHYARTISAIREFCGDVKVEALIPDFGAEEKYLARVIKAKPFVLGHNLETVARLTPRVRDHRAGYLKSLRVLEISKELDPSILIKSGIMVGLGETEDEVFQTMQDLRKAAVDILTIGQYLQPTRSHLPVVEFIPPERFARYKDRAREFGFKSVMAGPLVRSSYHAWEIAENL